MKKKLSLLALLIFLISFSAQCQKLKNKRSGIINVLCGQDRLWATDFKMIDDNSYYILGIFKNQLEIGDTLIKTSHSNAVASYVSLFIDNEHIKTISYEGERLSSNSSVDGQNNLIITTVKNINNDIEENNIIKFDTQLNIKWTVQLKRYHWQLGGGQRRAHVFDSYGNMYGLYWLNGNDTLEINGKKYVGTDFEYGYNDERVYENVVYKISPEGKIVWDKKVVLNLELPWLTIIKDQIIYRSHIGYVSKKGERTYMPHYLLDDQLYGYNLKSIVQRPVAELPTEESIKLTKSNYKELLKSKELIKIKGDYRNRWIENYGKRKIIVLTIGFPISSSMPKHGYNLNIMVVRKRNLKVLESSSRFFHSVHRDLLFEIKSGYLYIAGTSYQGAEVDNLDLDAECHKDSVFLYRMKL